MRAAEDAVTHPFRSAFRSLLNGVSTGFASTDGAGAAAASGVGEAMIFSRDNSAGVCAYQTARRDMKCGCAGGERKVMQR